MQAGRLTPLIANLTLEDIVARTPDLPSLPAAVLAVMREAESPDGSASSVARHLSQDQALAVRVLRLSNSAFYGLSRKVMDVSDAVVVLGMRSVRNLCMVASTYPWLNHPLKGYDLGPRQLWAHSLGVAVGSQVIAANTRKASPDQAFTAGLLHDIGKVALSIWFENKIETMAKLSQAQGVPFDAIERKILGYDHQDVGAHMAETWNLPGLLVDCMRYHHHPDDCERANPMVDMVHLADYLTMTVGLGVGGDGLRYDFCANSLVRLDLNPDDLDRLTDEFTVSYEKHEKLFEGMQG